MHGQVDIVDIRENIDYYVCNEFTVMNSSNMSLLPEEQCRNRSDLES